MANYNPQERHPQVRLRNRIMAASILLLAVVNCVAGYFDLHDTMAILFLNVAGVMLFVLAVVLELRRTACDQFAWCDYACGEVLDNGSGAHLVVRDLAG